MEFLAIVVAIILIVVFWRVFVAFIGLGIVAIFFLVALGSLQGCASSDPFTREYNDAATVENYKLCMEVYEQYNAPTVHRGHTHSNPGRVRLQDLRQDLSDNNCRRILGGLWVDSI